MCKIIFFKQEYLDLLDGRKSELFNYFKILIVNSFIELRKYLDELCTILLIMSEDSDLPCFQNFKIKDFRNRFKEEYSDKEVIYNKNKIKFQNFKYIFNSFFIFAKQYLKYVE